MRPGFTAFTAALIPMTIGKYVFGLAAVALNAVAFLFFLRLRRLAAGEH